MNEFIQIKAILGALLDENENMEKSNVYRHSNYEKQIEMKADLISQYANLLCIKMDK